MKIEKKIIEGKYRVVTINKEFLSYTLKNKVIIFFFVLHENYIDKKKRDKATPCLGDVLDSRAVVGLGERNLHAGASKNQIQYYSSNIFAGTGTCASARRTSATWPPRPA